MNSGSRKGEGDMKQREVFWGRLWGASHRIVRRGKPMRRPLTAGILVLAIVTQFGCAATPRPVSVPSEAVTAELGTVGVVVIPRDLEGRDFRSIKRTAWGCCF